MKTRKTKSQPSPASPAPEPRVLSIPEIILNICRLIDASDGTLDVDEATTPTQKRATLSNLARVAKRFTNPAFSFLWGEQHGLSALLYAFGYEIVGELADEKIVG